MPKQQRQRLCYNLWQKLWSTLQTSTLVRERPWMPWWPCWSSHALSTSWLMGWWASRWVQGLLTGWRLWSTRWMMESSDSVTFSTDRGSFCSTLCPKTTTWYTLLSLGGTCPPSWLGAIKERIWCTRSKFWHRGAIVALPPASLETRCWGSTWLEWSMHCLLDIALSLVLKKIGLQQHAYMYAKTSRHQEVMHDLEILVVAAESTLCLHTTCTRWIIALTL